MTRRWFCFIIFLTVVAVMYAVYCTKQDDNQEGTRKETGGQKKVEEFAADAEALINQLYSPEGKVKYQCWVNPGGPRFELSAPMKKLMIMGNRVQPLLLDKLKDKKIQREVAIILSAVGDKDCLPHLIDCISINDKLTKEEDFDYMCIVYALWQVTGMELGIDHKWGHNYSPDMRQKWRSWYEENKDYLYSPKEPRKTAYIWAADRILVDMEAKLQRTPTDIYRKEHPWVLFGEIEKWKDGPEYEHKLREFCFSMILNLLWSHGYYEREPIEALGNIDDPRALKILQKLSEMIPLDAYSAHVIIWTLGGRGDASSIPYLERFAKAENREIAERAGYELAYLRLLEKYGKELEGKPLSQYEGTLLMKCLAGSEGVNELLKMLETPPSDCSSAIEAAGFVKDERIKNALEKLLQTDNVKFKDVPICFGYGYTEIPGEVVKIRAAVALARLGEKSMFDYLRERLAHNLPGIRLATADALWNLGSTEGYETALSMLKLRPIETGDQGVRVGKDGFSVETIYSTNVDRIRKACELLGEMGNKSAISEIKKLLNLNLRGVSETGGKGQGWFGRPAVVALAKLGDFSGIEILVNSIKKGDSPDVARDFEKIGLKKYARELIPLLNHREEDERVLVAKVIINLLDKGK